MMDPYSIPWLSVCQPYAHLIVHGPKRIENRTWFTNYRGSIGIHASKGRKYLSDPHHFAGCEENPQLVFGAGIGTATLVECIREQHWPDDYLWVADDPFWEGPVGWILQDVQPIQPIVFPGQPGLFRIRRST